MIKQTLQDDAVKELVLDLNKQGYSTTAISRQIGIPRTTLSDFLNKNTYKYYTNGEVLNSNVRVLLIDLETAPFLAVAFSRFKQTFGEDSIIQEGYVMSFSAKFLGQETYITKTLPNYKLYELEEENDYALIKELYDLIETADVVIAHNLRGFDWKVFNTRCIYHGLPPVKPVKLIDTLDISKRLFKFPSNRLDSLANFLKIGRKTPHAGISLWVGCMKGDMDSWDKMAEYNANDVFLLEDVYLRLRPYDNKHPSLANLRVVKSMQCPVCCSDSLTETGTVTTNVSEFISYQCNNCGHYSRGRYNQKSKEEMKNTLVNIAS